jgi:hypothetical protein
MKFTFFKFKLNLNYFKLQITSNCGTILFKNVNMSCLGALSVHRILFLAYNFISATLYFVLIAHVNVYLPKIAQLLTMNRSTRNMYRSVKSVNISALI